MRGVSKQTQAKIDGHYFVFMNAVLTDIVADMEKPDLNPSTKCVMVLAKIAGDVLSTIGTNMPVSKAVGLEDEAWQAFAPDLKRLFVTGFLGQVPATDQENVGFERKDAQSPFKPRPRKDLS